ncbi:MAG: DUF4349 domain-containing protein [Methylobacillus sp.]|jgi:hypothetical protein|nr:DUF4349 domain-containing protein [Methylobacillus sp.]
MEANTRTRSLSARWLFVAAVTGAIALAGCGQQESGTRPAFAESAPQQPAAGGAYLAYEHSVNIELDVAEIPAHLQAAQTACQHGTYGACEVLEVSQRGGDYPGAYLTVRIVPDGVGPMIESASKGGEIGSRNTRAEDLAQAVRDNETLRERLRKERERLLEFQQRRDLSVADMIALSQQLAQVDAQTETAVQEAAQHQRRIDTQKLTLSFQPPDGQSSNDEIRRALRDFRATLAMGTAWTIRAVAFMIPLLLVIGVLWWGIRRLRRRKAVR